MRTPRLPVPGLVVTLVVLVGVLVGAVVWHLVAMRDDSGPVPAATSSSPATPVPPRPPPGTLPPTSRPTASAGTDDEGKPATGKETARPSSRRAATALSAAADTATQFVEAYARPAPGVSENAWWKKVSAFLTDQARQDYEGVDPATVPYSRVTGPARVLPPEGDEELVWMVQVPTDAGRYTVHLLPAGDERLSTNWRVSRLSPPASAP